MIYDLFLLVSIAATFGIMALGMKFFGLGGGVAGFVVGAVMTGVVAMNVGIDMGGAGCERYSSTAQDC